MHPRLRAVHAMSVPTARELVGLHADFDGVVQDLSDGGVRTRLAALGGPPLDDPHDEAHLSAFERDLRFRFGVVHEHRWNPLPHIGNLDLACYDREYAPAKERAAARRRHLAAWPDAVEASLTALVAVPREVAAGLLGAAQGLAADVPADGDTVHEAALAAHGRLVGHLDTAAREAEPFTGLGGPVLSQVLGIPEALRVDLGRLAERADAEQRRLRDLLADSVRALGFTGSVGDAVGALTADHPTIDGVLEEARAQTEEVLAFTRASGLVPDHDGACLVGPAPASRAWAMAMLSPAAAYEDDGPSWYHVTPPDPTWPPEAQSEWLAVFSRTTLPAITVHEVAPGHFTHFRCIRSSSSDVRRSLYSNAFAEGWAHYAEELLLEEGFRADDRRYAAGVAIEALVRVTRLAVSIGVHTGAMTLQEASARFEHDAHLQPAAARSEAVRATFDPGYGCYTWGKLVITDLRERARAQWGSAYSHRRFHTALLDLGAPPLGLVETVLGGSQPPG
jgi:hypothetical protein